MRKVVLWGAVALLWAGASSSEAFWDRWDRGDRDEDVAAAVVGGVVGSVLENVLAPRREERVIIREERDDWRRRDWREDERLRRERAERAREDALLREAEQIRRERAEEARLRELNRWDRRW